MGYLDSRAVVGNNTERSCVLLTQFLPVLTSCRVIYNITSRILTRIQSGHRTFSSLWESLVLPFYSHMCFFSLAYSHLKYWQTFILSFQKCYINGIIPSITLGNWLLPFNINLWSFFPYHNYLEVYPDCVYFNSSFLFVA